MRLLYDVFSYIVGMKIKIKSFYKRRKFNAYAILGDGCIIEHGSNILNDGPQDNIIIGSNCNIICTLISVSGGKIFIGNNTTIRFNSVIGSIGNVRIGSHCIISNNVHIYDNNNHTMDAHIRWNMCESGFYGEPWSWRNSAHKDVVVEDNVWIGERSTILKGVHIGKGAIIGCDSVVVKDIPDYAIAVGNPARVVKNLKN